MSESKDQVSEVSPSSFKVDLELKKDIFLEIKIKNIHDGPIAYKVKTTAPGRYAVRPTQHIVEEGATHKCKVVLSTLEEYPDVSNPKSLRDKFRVQSVAIDSNTTIEELGALWKRLESSHKPKEGVILYQEDKIKVKLVVPASQRALVASEKGEKEAMELTQQHQVMSEEESDHNENLHSEELDQSAYDYDDVEPEESDTYEKLTQLAAELQEKLQDKEDESNQLRENLAEKEGRIGDLEHQLEDMKRVAEEMKKYGDLRKRRAAEEEEDTGSTNVQDITAVAATPSLPGIRIEPWQLAVLIFIAFLLGYFV